MAKKEPTKEDRLDRVIRHRAVLRRAINEAQLELRGRVDGKARALKILADSIKATDL